MNQNKKQTSTREHDTASAESSPKMTSKRLAALIGAALLVMLYIVTLIMAITDTSASGRWLQLCFLATVAVPLLIWLYTWMYGRLTGRRTIADLDAGTKYGGKKEALSGETADTADNETADKELLKK